MDAGEVLSDRQLVSELIRSFMDLTAANIEAQQTALERLRALADGQGFFEYDALARHIQRGDVVLYRDEWRSVDGSGPCNACGCWLLALDPFDSVHVGAGESFRVRRPRGERAA